MTNEHVPYTRFDGFENLYLEDSFVLDVAARPGRLTISAELILTEGHPDYREPRSDERYCMRDGVIEFASVRSLRWTGQGIPPSTDASGSIDYGSIDALHLSEGVIHIEGDFGQIEMESARPVVSFTDVLQEGVE
jgi:hypothetical protein